MTNLDWLRGLNDPGRAPGTLLASPWSIEHEGVTWNFATQGHVIVLVRGLPVFPPSPKQGLDGPRGTLMYKAPTLRVSLAALKSFVGAPKQETCDACKGCGKDICEACERPYPDLTCEACDGTSKQWVNETILVHGAMLNRHLLARGLEHLNDPETVRISGEDGKDCKVIVEAPGWRVVVMDLLSRIRTEDERKPIPEFNEGT